MSTGLPTEGVRLLALSRLNPHNDPRTTASSQPLVVWPLHRHPNQEVRCFATKVQSFPGEDVRRAKATVLKGGPVPENPRELDRFYWLVWLVLTGVLIPQV